MAGNSVLDLTDISTTVRAPDSLRVAKTIYASARRGNAIVLDKPRPAHLDVRHYGDTESSVNLCSFTTGDEQPAQVRDAVVDELMREVLRSGSQSSMGDQLQFLECEMLFDKLAATSGYSITRKAREAQIMQWRFLGVAGVKFLLGKLGVERRPHVLNWVSAVFAELAPESLLLITDHLEHTSDETLAEALLSTFGKLPRKAPMSERLRSRIRKKILDFKIARDPGCREAAVLATRVLSTEEARSILQAAANSERNQTVRQTILDEIEDMSLRDR